MFWPILVILYIGIIIWVLLYLIKLQKFALAGSDFKQEEKSFVFSVDTPFVFSRKNELSNPVGRRKSGPEKTFAFIEKAEKPEIKLEIKRTDKPFPLYDKKHTRSSKIPILQSINIANVTRDLIGFVMKMSGEEKHRLLKEKTNHRQPFPDHDNPKMTTKHLFEMIMSMSLEDRCGLLGEFKSRIGMSRRKFARKNYMTPVYFVVKGMLQNAYTKNLSNCGVLIETFKVMARKFVPGELITMSLLHPQIRKEIKIQGKIIRVTPSTIAVCFDKPL